MTVEAIMGRISNFLNMLIDGHVGGSYTDSEGIITQWCHFIIDHPIVLFFVLCSVIYIGISLMRRLTRV